MPAALAGIVETDGITALYRFDEPWTSLLIRIWHVPNLKELNPDADALLRFLVNASAPSRAGMETL